MAWITIITRLMEDDFDDDCLAFITKMLKAIMALIKH